MKKRIALLAGIAALTAFAAPHRPPAPSRHVPPRPSVHRPAPPPSRPFHHSSSGWFWTGFGAKAMLDAFRSTPYVTMPITTTPIVVGPVVPPTRVWVPPVYETRPVVDSFGRIVGYQQVLVRPGYWQ